MTYSRVHVLKRRWRGTTRCRAKSGHAVDSRATFGHRRAFRATFRHRRAPERPKAARQRRELTKAARQRHECPKVARQHRRNAASVRISPGNAGGTPRMSKNRPKTRMACQTSVQKPPANVAQGPASDSRPMRPRRPRLQPLADARQLFSYEHVENPR